MVSPLDDHNVAVASTGSADYGSDAEERGWRALLVASEALGWRHATRGPLAQVIPPAARVAIKPNLVSHENQAPYGVEPLLTHRSIIDAAFRAAQAAGAQEIIVGDAPIQRCDFPAMLRASGLDEWAQMRAACAQFNGVRDFRRTVSTVHAGVRRACEDRLGMDQFTLFDLGTSSLLEPVTRNDTPFRVTCYDPRLLERTHAPGKHQYLVARDLLRADVVINVPKLKMHRKAGITGALKNLVGINGNKEFLPHHRAGGARSGGDCYPGASRAKAMLEYVLDQQNSAESVLPTQFWAKAQRAIGAFLKSRGDRLGVEGAWSGNDTVWRMCLDLNRILIYGRTDGTLADEPQRTVIHLVDAVIAGQGEGPLAPEPLPLGLVLLGQNAAAVDWVGAWLLGYDPWRIPLTRNAFEVAPWPIARFAAAAVEICGDLGSGKANHVLPSQTPTGKIHYPVGWVDAAASSVRGLAAAGVSGHEAA